MTYVPSAYVQLIGGHYHIIINTPSGMRVALKTTYKRISDAKAGIVTLGFAEVPPPKPDTPHTPVMATSRAPRGN